MRRLVLLAARDSIHTVRWANALANRGYDVHLVSIRRSGDPLQDSVKTHYLSYPVPFGYFLNVRELRRLLEHIKPDVFHAHYASGYGTLGRLARYHPYVLSVWGSDVYDFPERSLYHRNLIIRNLEAADWVCSTSRVMAEHTSDLGAIIPKLSITPFGIDLALFRPKPELRDSDTITVGTVKALDEKYGIDILISAFAQARTTIRENGADCLAARLRLSIIGDGPLRSNYEVLAKDLGVYDVCEFVGRVPHHQVPDYLNRLDIYVAVSRLDSESFGVAIVEASACGLPVIVSDVGGLPEVVVNGKTGFVVPRESVDATATSIMRLAESPGLRQEIGEVGRQHVKRHYEWSQNVTQMEHVYREVTDIANAR